MLYKFEYVM